MITPNIIELLREESIKSCFQLSAFKGGWSTWKTKIHSITSGRFNSSNILSLGDHLSEIFLSTGSAGRGQSQVSGGGYGWEGLICWYLNLCFAGSRAVAIKKVSSLPQPLRDSISVNYGSFKSNTESDITIVVFPDNTEFVKDKSSLEVIDSSGNSIPLYNSRKAFNSKKIIDELAAKYFDKFELGIIQCKTNWNDNAQIPMLWSMIYEAKFDNPSISIGRDGYSIQHIKRFSYSFCTVPTNKLSNYKTNSTSVHRVRNLTGGNYWGRPSDSGIASSIKEIFNRNFNNAFTPNQRFVLDSIVNDLSDDLDYFDLI
ncbi:MAG: hypothetical protein P1U70_22000 [Saprospiraceae bacterium]|jgi:hypothetical protein|nr:hypothetical protein [Saprospiraceae bacterium]